MYNYPNLKNTSLLLVEDDIDLRTVLHDLLYDYFKDITVASNGLEAVVLYKKGQFDIILSDIHMPYLDGIEMSKKIRTINPKQYIAFLTALSDTSIVQEALNMQINKFITKPIVDFELCLESLEEIAKSILSQKFSDQKIVHLLEKTRILDEHIISCTLDLSGNITEMSKAFLNVTKYKQEELLNQNYLVLKPNEFLETNFMSILENLQEGQHFYRETEQSTKDNELFWVDLIIKPIFIDNQTKIAYQLIQGNITEKKKIEKESTLDPLTSIYNRRKFNQVLESEQNKIDRYDTECSLIMLDIDLFKFINDTYGHMVGDTILKEFTALVTENIRNIDTFARWGGEEFIILTPNTGLQEAVTLAEKLRVLTQKNIFTHNIQMTCSFGVKKLLKNHELDSTIIKLDQSLYQSKKDGRNRVSVC